MIETLALENAINIPPSGNQEQRKHYYMRYRAPAFISSNRKTSKQIRIRKNKKKSPLTTEQIPPLKNKTAGGYMISYLYNMPLLEIITCFSLAHSIRGAFHLNFAYKCESRKESYCILSRAKPVFMNGPN